MSKENKKLVRHIIEEVENRGNFTVADELVGGDFMGHSPLKEIHGPEGFKQFYAMLRTAFPDFHCTVEDQVAEEDKVMTRWTARGTHKGEFQGIPPTGRQMTITGITLARIANDKIVEGWTNVDILGMLQQLGAVPAPEQAC